MKNVLYAYPSDSAIKTIKRVLVSFLIFLIAYNIQANTFYVTPTADANATGTISDPWQLQFALNHPTALQPGDTVYLRGGVYNNNYSTDISFFCKTKGTADKPIIFRNYLGERAILDGDLDHTLWCGLSDCYETWFWGIEIVNSSTAHRKQARRGSIYCTAKNMKFINMIVHDLGEGFDNWNTASNNEIYGCIIYSIGNNELNNGNWEGHGHAFYMQNDTIGTKTIHNNIVFNTFGFGLRIWQTNNIIALGNFDIQDNVFFNCGSASENLGGPGNNYRTHNMFVISNGANNPVRNTIIKRNYTYSSPDQPRPPVNAFGLNQGVVNMILDSNYLMCQTRLGHNNTPVFDASVAGNNIIAGIPPEYGYYLWGFTQDDYPNNLYAPVVPDNGMDYFFKQNKYEPDKRHLVIYNWGELATVKIPVTDQDLHPGDQYTLINATDYFNDTLFGTVGMNGTISIPMDNRTCTEVYGSNQVPVNPYPKFGVFILQKTKYGTTPLLSEGSAENVFHLFPNPVLQNKSVYIKHSLGEVPIQITLFDSLGKVVIQNQIQSDALSFDTSGLPKGIYYYRIYSPNKTTFPTGSLIIL